MSIDEATPQASRTRRRRRRLRLTVLGTLVLVAMIAVGLAAYRRQIDKDERPTIAAIYKGSTPVADGVIRKDEYGPGVNLQWTANNTLAAFEHGFGDATTNKPPSDLQVTLHAAYTKTSLFFAFRVRDQFVDAQVEDAMTPNQNDGVEIFIDGDREHNDFDGFVQFTGRAGSPVPSEGFQLLVDAAGHQFTRAKGFTDGDWKRAVRRTADGYIVEMEIPLALIDCVDGAGVKPPGPGSLLNMALAFTDNDQAIRQQVSYAYLQTSARSRSPYLGGEAAWVCGVRLERHGLLQWPW